MMDKPVLGRLCTLNTLSNMRKHAVTILLLKPLSRPLLTLQIKAEHLSMGHNTLIFEILFISVALFPMTLLTWAL